MAHSFTLKEKVFIDSKKKIRVFLLIVSMILLVISICLAILVFKYTEKKEEIISVDNAERYFEITPWENFVTEVYGINVYGSIVAKSQILEPSLTLEFTIQYYYINKNNNICEPTITISTISISSSIIFKSFMISLFM